MGYSVHLLLCLLASLHANKINWTEYDPNQESEGVPKVDLSRFNNRDLCKPVNGTNELPCITELHPFILAFLAQHDNNEAFRASCDPEPELAGPNGQPLVCWFRKKVYNAKTASKRTKFQMQFYQKNGKCTVRYADGGQS